MKKHYFHVTEQNRGKCYFVTFQKQTAWISSSFDTFADFGQSQSVAISQASVRNPRKRQREVNSRPQRSFPGKLQPLSGTHLFEEGELWSTRHAPRTQVGQVYCILRFNCSFLASVMDLDQWRILNDFPSLFYIQQSCQVVLRNMHEIMGGSKSEKGCPVSQHDTR